MAASGSAGWVPDRCDDGDLRAQRLAPICRDPRGWTTTLPGARGRGAARSILASLADWATAEVADRMYLQVESDNDPALHLYDRTCFTEVWLPLRHRIAFTNLR